MLAVWQEQWIECLGNHFEPAQQLSEAQETRVQAPGSALVMASYQFQIRARQPAAPILSNMLMRAFIAGGVSRQIKYLTCTNHDACFRPNEACV